MSRHQRAEAKRARRRARIAQRGTPAWVRDQRDEALREAGYVRWTWLASKARQPFPKPAMVELVELEEAA